MKGFISLLIFIILLPAGAAAFIWSGIYDVSAASDAYSLSNWLIDTIKENSVAMHAEGIGIPAYLDDPDIYEKGLRKFDASCRHCHGGPGEPREEFAAGLHPPPPVLISGRVQKEWTDPELYLIIRNGLKFTGMPAFGASHRDAEIWKIIGILKILPDLKPSEYREIISENEEPGEGEELPEEENGSTEPNGYRMMPNTI